MGSRRTHKLFPAAGKLNRRTPPGHRVSGRSVGRSPQCQTWAHYAHSLQKLCTAIARPSANHAWDPESCNLAIHTPSVFCAFSVDTPMQSVNTGQSAPHRNGRTAGELLTQHEETQDNSRQHKRTEKDKARQHATMYSLRQTREYLQDEHGFCMRRLARVLPKPFGDGIQQAVREDAAPLFLTLSVVVRLANEQCHQHRRSHLHIHSQREFRKTRFRFLPPAAATCCQQRRPHKVEAADTTSDATDELGGKTYQKDLGSAAQHTRWKHWTANVFLVRKATLTRQSGGQCQRVHKSPGVRQTSQICASSSPTRGKAGSSASVSSATRWRVCKRSVAHSGVVEELSGQITRSQIHNQPRMSGRCFHGVPVVR